MLTPRLIHNGIIVAAFFTMYSIFQSLLATLLMLFMNMTSEYGYVGEGAVISILVNAGFLLLTLLVINKSGIIANWLGNQSKITNELKVKLSYTKTLTIAITAYSFFQLLKQVPFLINFFIDKFGEKIERSRGMNGLFGETKVETYNWLQMIVEIVLYIVVIYAAKPISEWFTRNFEKDEDEFSFEDNGDPKLPATETTIEA